MTLLPLPLVQAARFSPCRRYRYTLHRRLSVAGPRALWVMLNPSTADDEQDDPTIRRVIGFSRREGFGSLVVCNIFGLRSTDPRGLLLEHDPAGEDNDDAIARAACDADRVIVAWGSWGDRFPERVRRVDALLAPQITWCLGTTGSGQPRHPLYQRGDAPLVPWRGP